MLKKPYFLSAICKNLFFVNKIVERYNLLKLVFDCFVLTLTVGSNKKLTRVAGLTQAQFAERICTKQSSISLPCNKEQLNVILKSSARILVISFIAPHLNSHVFVCTIIYMKIEFDIEKDKENIKKHGISLSEANNILWDETLAWPEKRFEYNEWRMVAIAPIGNRLYYVSYVDKGEKIRIISLRATTNAEKKYYAQIYNY